MYLDNNPQIQAFANIARISTVSQKGCAKSSEPCQHFLARVIDEANFRNVDNESRGNFPARNKISQVFGKPSDKPALNPHLDYVTLVVELNS
jgi:hypothetical protein